MHWITMHRIHTKRKGAETTYGNVVENDSYYTYR